MAIKDVGDPEIAHWDQLFIRRQRNVIGPLISLWFRSEVRGLDLFPPSGPALVVSNHSGGMMTPDVLVFAKEFYDKFGYQRPIYTVAHYGLFIGHSPNGWGARRCHPRQPGKSRQGAAGGAVVLTFPGGDYDAYRPTLSANMIDFNGRTGYVRTALEANVPVVPTVSIGAQESQLFLTRGHWLAKRLGLKRIRMEIVPVSFGLPFGFTVMAWPPNLPLPTKIVTEVLEQIDIIARFGKEPDVGEVDENVRSVMQAALDRLARQRRLPVLG